MSGRVGPLPPSSTGYIVDDYSPVAAYSLNKLSSTATNAVRVRRASDNSEQDIGFSGNDLDVTSLATFCSGTSGYVVTWYDQANSNDITNATAANQPRIFTSGTIQPLTGTSPARYGVTWGISGNQRLSATALTEMDSGNDFSIFAVGVGDGASAQTYVSTRNTTSVDRFVMRAGNAGPVGVVHNGTTNYTTSGTGSANTSYIMTLIMDGTAKTMNSWRDSTSVGNVTWTGSYTNAILSVGLDRDNDWEMDVIGCILIFGTDRTSDRADIESDLNDYFGTH